MSDQRRIHRARLRLRELWTAPHAYANVAAIARELVPSAEHAVAYDVGQLGELGECGHTFDATGTGWTALSSATDGIRRFRQFSTTGPDPYANRTVTTKQLFRGREEELEGIRGQVWKKLGQHSQLRIAFYDKERFQALVAVLKGPCTAHDFAAGEASSLEAVKVDLRNALTAAQALGPVPASRHAIARTLDAFEQPAFLTLGTGAIVHANTAARASYPRTPRWLPTAVRNPAILASLAAVTRIEYEARSLFLVIPRQPPVASATPRPSLPPSLARVAALAAEGLSDKEISDALDIPLATVRTYMQRTYRTLGVHSRVELCRIWSKRG